MRSCSRGGVLTKKHKDAFAIDRVQAENQLYMGDMGEAPLLQSEMGWMDGFLTSWACT